MTIPIPLLLTGSALAILISGFVVWFLVPAIRHWFRLRDIQRQLADTKAAGIPALTKIFAVDEGLAHLWSEYAETLHTQTDDRDGQSRILAIRSTVPAEMYFNSQYVVDSRLRTEFFKHLPGVFTGVGIIGTFSGLIAGLRQFRIGIAVSPNPSSANAVTGAVEGLLREVSQAFLVSAAAITAAMAVTFIEKLLIASLYKRTERIAQDIDARFNSGAGEEYLARLVIASEDSASQSKILKDALVNELGALLREISDNQIQESRHESQALAGAISGSITDSLSQPLKDIAVTVRAASGDQSATASRMLTDVLSSFSERLNELFGGQISGLSDLNKDTASSVREVAQTLNLLVANIERASVSSSDAMAVRMATAVEAMEQRQASINSQTVAFVEQLRQLVSTSQSETSVKMQEALAVLGQQVGGMVESLRVSNEESVAGNGRREESLRAHASSAVAAMTGSVESVVTAMAVASTRMQEAVGTISQAASASLEKMNYGADTLNAAATNFANAGDRVSGSLSAATLVTGKLTELAGALTSSASTLQETVNEYRSHRDAVTSLVSELRTVVESAKREASLTADVLARIESSAQKLAAAQLQADHYLEGVNKVLAEAHQKFADATTRTLDRANQDFHKKLTQAVALLSSSIEEFESKLGSS